MARKWLENRISGRKWKIKIGMRKNIICHVNYNHVENGTIPKYVLEPHREIILEYAWFLFREISQNFKYSHECFRQRNFSKISKIDFFQKFKASRGSSIFRLQIGQFLKRRFLFAKFQIFTGMISSANISKFLKIEFSK